MIQDGLKNKMKNKTKEKRAVIAVHENPRDGFDNYSSGMEIMNQVASEGPALPE